MKTYEIIKMHEVAMDNLSPLKNKFVYTIEMEKDINDERLEARLHSFKKEISDEIKSVTQDINALFNFNPVLPEFLNNIIPLDKTDENVNKKLEQCLSLLRKDHDYYMFEHQICVFIVRYGHKEVNVHRDFLNVLESEMSDLKKHFNKKYNRNINKNYIEEIITKIVSLIKPLIKQISDQGEYEDYLKKREILIENQRYEHFYNPLSLEKLRVIKSFISREDFEKALIKHDFNPCLNAFSHSIEIRCENIVSEVTERKAKEYYDLI